MGKYFKYAIGEILLVVIGILIALQINNWSETRKLNKKETIYLKSLKVDFEQSKLALARVIEKTDRVSKMADTLVSLIKINGNELSLTQIDTLTSKSSGFTVFMPSEGVISDIISSGKLDMISNNELREKIASWEANLKMIREFEAIGREISNDYINYKSKYFDLANRKFRESAFISAKRDEFLNDNLFSNYLARIFGNSSSLNELYVEKLEEIDRLIKIINNELK
ncbi:DUF6090 family protein [Winogradskyella alexanderae]|uniref:Uncharacterized protein n=1 Tax=Winogradskyella alexanderae TaxID=2877123 RepID=A0ABS7XYD8_9FLAO|nr:DUF6090 family protein [Winogradskyella alexanderae]MCA0133811.1 hypothetical protein [Winogradskyella alexanderae]